jgi:O-antigen/teichoic acid export membrane protein
MGLADQIKSLTKDSVVYGLSSVFGKFISFFLIPLYTASIAPHEYGVYGLTNNTFLFLNILLVLALDNSTARWIYDTTDEAERKRTVNTWLWFYLGLSLLVTLSLLLFRSQVSQVVLKSDGYVRPFSLLMLALPFNCFITVASNVLRFVRKPLALLTLSLLQSLVLVVLNLISVRILGWGLDGIFGGMLASYVIGSILALLLIRRWISWPPRIEWVRLKAMLRYSWPFIPAGISIWLVNVSGGFFLNYFLDQKEAGLFQLGSSFASILAVFVAAFQQAWMPFAFSIMKQEAAGRTYAAVFYLFTSFMCMLCVGTALFAPDILRLLVPPAYYSAASVITILAFNYLFASLINIADLGCAISKKTKPLGGAMMLSAVLILILNPVLIPAFGKEGAALATCLAQATAVVVLFRSAQRLYYIPYNFPAALAIIGFAVGIWVFSVVVPMQPTFGNWMLRIALFLGFCGLIAYQQKTRLRLVLQRFSPVKNYIA